MALLSTSSASKIVQGPITLSLFKLSHCTASSPSANMIWTHLPNRDNMFAVFDRVRSHDNTGKVVEQQVLKLVRGGELLEIIRFDSLEHQVRMDAQRCQTQQIPDNLLNVIVIVKRPLLALRYQIEGGQIRKIQMNFQPEQGCDIALNHLGPIGMPIRDKAQPAQLQATPLRPSSSQAAFPSSQARPQARPQAREGGLNHVSDQIPSSAQLQPTTMRPHLSQAPFSGSQHSSQGYEGATAGVYNQTHHSAQPQPTPSRLYPSQPAFSGSQPGFQGHPDITADVYSQIPPSAQPSQTQINPPMLTARHDPDGFSKPISYGQDTRSHYHVDYGYHHVNRTTSVSGNSEPKSQSLMLPPTSSQSLLPSPIISCQSSSYDGFENRPSSAPTTQSERLLSDTVPISEMLPPRRQLPFPEEPPKLDSTDIQEESQEPPKKKQAKAKVTKAKGTKSKPAKLAPSVAKIARVDQVPSSSAPEAQPKRPPARKSKPIAVRKLPVFKESNQNIAPAMKVVDKTPPSSAPPKVTPRTRALAQAISKSTEAVSPLPSPENAKATKKRPLSAINDSDLNKGQTQSPAAPPSSVTGLQAQPQPEQPRNLLPNISTTDLLDSLDGWIRKYHDLPAPKPPKTSKEMLAEYATLNDEERAKAIDNMIVRCLEDKNFVKLMEDVERHWQRVYLGF